MKTFIMYVFLPIILIYSSIANAADNSCDYYSSSVATDPAPQTTLEGRRDAETLSRGGVEDSPDVVLIGDSLFAGWRASEAFRGLTVFNFSVRGDRTQNVLWRFRKMNQPPPTPKAIALLIGTNNLRDTTISGCGIFSGIEAISQRARAVWPGAPIFVLTIPPRGQRFIEYNSTRMEVNKLISSLHDKYHDIYPVEFNDKLITCGLYDVSTPHRYYIIDKYTDSCDNYVKDGLHFRAGGYAIIRSMLVDASERYLLQNVFSN